MSRFVSRKGEKRTQGCAKRVRQHKEHKIMMGKGIWSAIFVTLALAVGHPAARAVNLVTPTVETPSVLAPGDADDPAIWLHPTDPSLSLVLGTKKNAGLSVYDLLGNELQSINPASGVRYNNVDVQYGFKLGDQVVDIAVASDRRNDKLSIFSINPNTRQLEDITDGAIGTIFTPAGQPSNGTTTAYGLALYRSPLSGKYYAFASKRTTGTVAQLELFDSGAGKISAKTVRTFNVSSQVEGMVADQQLGYLYIAEEDVGIWKFLAEPDGGSTGTLIDAVKPTGKNIEADAEGLTIYYTSNGKGYLLASSQGDSTFAVYTREGNNDYLGSFLVGGFGGIDSVQNSDGADVINVPLGSQFPLGLFVTHDGNNDPDGSTNFKYVPWQNVANAFFPPLAIDTTSYNPRNPNSKPVPEPTTTAGLVLFATLGLSGQVLRRRRV